MRNILIKIKENSKLTCTAPLSCLLEEIRNEDSTTNQIFFVKLDGINNKQKKNSALLKIANDFKLENKYNFDYFELILLSKEEDLKKIKLDEKKTNNFMVSLKNRPSEKKKKRSSIKDKAKENNFSNILSNKFETDDENEIESDNGNKFFEKHNSKHSIKSKSKENTSMEIK